MKLSDYVIDFFARLGVRHGFLVSGGAVIHLVDSCAKHPKMQPICSQHEQLGAASADMYARLKGLGLAMSTSGPGATNMVTSVCNAYFDSVPLVCLTGQVARFRIKNTPQLRQRGFQETDVVSIFKSITKYTQLILDPLTIRYELEKAIYLATEGRPGPVVLDIPDDLQRVEIDPSALIGFVPPPPKKYPQLEEKIAFMLQLIEEASRPVLIYGLGVRTAKAHLQARHFAEHFGIPVVLTWGGYDLFEADHPLNMGGVGVVGPRSGNFAVQNADLIIAAGTRLSQMVTGGKQSLFSPHSKKVMIDVDEEELNKFNKETFVIDLPILADLKVFFDACEPHYGKKQEGFDSWKETICSWKKRYPIYDASKKNTTGRVDPYFFIKQLSKCCQEDDVIIGDTGANLSWTLQAFETKKGQQIFSAWNHTPMGYSLPASIGAALALEKSILCLIGDGGLMMCLQELATVKRHALPIRIFVFDNQGHGIQKQTIDTWLNSHYVAVDEASGLCFPDYEKLTEAFHLPYFCLKNDVDVAQKLPEIWKNPGPFVCNVEVIQNQKIVPMLKFGAGLEDLDPKLASDELKEIMEEGSHLEKLLI